MNKKLKAILIAFLLLITATILPTQNVKAASKSTMTKAYKKYLKKHVSKNKRYAIVNIGDNNKPALLISSSNKMDYAGNGKYFGCSVYYYQNGKVKKVCGFSGARRISLRKKNKKYYIYTGASDVSENLRIQKGKAYKAGYYNCHKKIPEDCWKKSKITLGKKTIKNYGYLSAEQYVKYRDSYKQIREITFKKNKK